MISEQSLGERLLHGPIPNFSQYVVHHQCFNLSAKFTSTSFPNAPYHRNWLSSLFGVSNPIPLDLDEPREQEARPRSSSGERRCRISDKCRQTTIGRQGLALQICDLRRYGVLFIGNAPTRTPDLSFTRLTRTLSVVNVVNDIMYSADMERMWME